MSADAESKNINKKYVVIGFNSHDSITAFSSSSSKRSIQTPESGVKAAKSNWLYDSDDPQLLSSWENSDEESENPSKNKEGI